ncbi:iron-containing alcohol dehydrogenase family protein [Priestia flexa]|uniref:iron-containing alcohol dehydrogenase family protein n=1 Tax=Priestia flexa TaxID=86664 RepID=UPI00240E4164|nr:iron-containing alcohol dehydrogenase family protein [Priestia flexa]WEZ06620.1 iron-containing alcohol dehydrogenase family protein [Priestia flexa]
MSEPNIVRSGPNHYICEIGAAKKIDEYIASFSRPVVFTGFKSFDAFNQYGALPEHIPVIQHKGYCYDEDIHTYAKELYNVDLVIGIGGGIVLDSAKSLADYLDVEVILVPTIPGTCAATTPLSVMYDGDGQYVRVDYHKRASFLTVVDPKLLLSSPVNYVKSGIGDTLAKWYEADAIIRNTKNTHELSAMVYSGLNQAKYIRDILMADSEAAIKSLQEQKVTPAFTRVVESIIMIAGTVGGFAVQYGRVSGAHAVHNGLSFVEEAHHVLHGQKVTYGILVQLMLENQLEVVKELIPFYEALGFPRTLSDLGIKEKEEAKQLVATHAIKEEEALRFIGNFTKEEVINAMDQVEDFTLSTRL